MKNILILILLFIPNSGLAQVQTCFTPSPCDEAIIAEINKAKSQINIAAYYLTVPKIVQALVDSKAKIRVFLDKSQKKVKSSQANYLKTNNISVKFDTNHAIMHHKFMVIDKQTVITGSYNFTKSAQLRNAENVLIIHDKQVAQKYDQEFEKQFKQAK